jgi:transcriptional regulator with XRE-family HTH domain
LDRAIGARIRERRHLLGLTQAELAERVGVARRQIHKYEAGTDGLTAGQLYVIAQVLGVEPSYFFDGSRRATARRGAGVGTGTICPPARAQLN